MIVVLGSCVLDMVFGAAELPVLGRTVLADSLRMHPGGKGLNQAFAAARSGAAVSMVGRVGADDNGAMLRRLLDAEGIDTAHLSTAEAPSGVGVPIVVPSGDNGIVFYGGANDTLTPEDVAAAAAAIEAAGLLLLQLELPIATAVAAASIAERYGTKVLLNAAPAAPIPAELLERTTVLVANQLESDELVAGGDGADAAGEAAGDAVGGAATSAATLREIQPHDLPQLVEQTSAGTSAGTSAATLREAMGVPAAIVTRGAAGVSWATGDRQGAAPAWPVGAVDAVGAGDAFVGAFAAQYAMARPLTEAVHYANAAAAISVTRRGAATAAPLRSEVEAFLREQPAPA